MRALAAMIAVVTVVGTATGAAAQFSLPGGLGRAIGGSGGAFAAVATSFTMKTMVSLRNMVDATRLMQEAVGNKEQAERLAAIAEELKRIKEPKADIVEKTMRAVDENPIDRAQLAAVKTEEGKQKVAESSLHVTVAAAFNAAAGLAARQLLNTKPGALDLIHAPVVLDAARVAGTVLPTQAQKFGEYSVLLTEYLRDNNIPPPSKEDLRAIAVKSGASPEEAQALL